MHPKDAEGMANRVDPDRTAISEADLTGSTRFAHTCLLQYFGLLRYLCSIVVHHLFHPLVLIPGKLPYCNFPKNCDTLIWLK